MTLMAPANYDVALLPLLASRTAVRLDPEFLEKARLLYEQVRAGLIDGTFLAGRGSERIS